MQLEAGKKYTDRRGRVYGPLVKTFGKFFGEHKETSLWDHDGRICYFDLDMDLVAEYVEPAQAEYRMLQDGETVQPDDEYCGHSGKWEKVPSTGNVFKSSLYYPHRRLVEPVKVAEPAPVESPDDLVIQDRVPARAGIDFGWNVMAGEFADYKPSDKWKWGIGEPYAGRMHGCVGGLSGGISDLRLAVFCRRKDLPPVPHAEPEFPQYIIYATGGTFADCAYIVRTSEDDAYSVLANGKRGGDFKWVAYKANILKSGVWKRVTEKEAEKLVSRTRTVVLKEWIVGEECGYVGCIWASEDPSKESDDLVSWGWASETGNTRTVEIPVT